MTAPTPGTVYLIGAGPGDPGLLTLRGKACLEQADVVVYDYLANAALLEHARPEAERVYAGKRRGKPPGMPQEKINALMIQKAREGKTVARLKGGDPFIFGRGGEEAEALAHAGVPFELVPGVTAATAAAAYAGIPLTHRTYSSSVALITGHEDPAKATSAVPWDALGRGFDTLVFFMGLTTLPAVVKRLRQAGRPARMPIAVIRWGTTAEQQTVTGTLADIVARARRAKITPPALIVAGEVVRLRDTLNWFEKKALFGKKVLVTRTREQAGVLSRQLREAGAEPIVCPTIQVVPPDSWRELDRALTRLDRFDWVVFTSANGVRFFTDRLAASGKDLRALAGYRVCAIGPGTAQALAQVGITADLVPESFVAEGIIAAMRKRVKTLKGCRVLLPRAQTAREVLPEALRAMGATVEVITAYKTVRPAGATERLKTMLRSGQIAVVTFTSASTVKHFFEILGGPKESTLKALLNGAKVASIGPITARAAAALGITTHIMPKAYTIPALTTAIVDYFNGRGTSPGGGRR